MRCPVTQSILPILFRRRLLRCVRWGYEVNASSDGCINAIDSYFHQVLSYGRNWKVILEAPLHNKDCVLGNVLAAHHLSSSDHSKANTYVEAARSNLEQSTSYEKAVFEAVCYLISEDRDDDLALKMHTQLFERFPKDLASVKRAQVLCFYMRQPTPFLSLVQQTINKEIRRRKWNMTMKLWANVGLVQLHKFLIWRKVPTST